MEDIDRIMALMGAAFEPRYREAWTRRQVVDALTLGNCHYDIIDAFGHAITPESDAAGFTLSRTGFEEEELLLLGVVPAFRGRGLGRALLERLRHAARDRGARRLLLEMRRGNPAESLYSKFGFSNIGERKDYYRTLDGQSIDAITFAVSL